MKLRVETHCYPWQEAKDMWDQIKAVVPESECDEKGPAHSKHRQPMPTRDYTSLAQSIAQLKELDVRSAKRQRLKGPEQLATLQQGLSEGHASFNNNIFAAAGGLGAAAVLEVTGQPTNSFGSTAKTMFSQQLEDAKMQQQEKKKETTVKVKFFDVEINKNRLLGKFDNLYKSLSQRVTAVEEVLAEAEKLATANESNQIPNLSQAV